ncbi:MAG: glycosyltransferase [Chloroflexota bacterium]|nr:MAG: glycosyltransferase [Chloroflexota bacterium]
MRIAMVGPFGFHPNKTMRSRALSLARILVRRGHDVKMFMPPWQTPDESNRSWSEEGVNVRYTPLGGGAPMSTVRLIREVAAWSPDVLHCFKPKAYSGFVAWWFWHFQRQRVRLVTDSDDWEGAGGWNEVAAYSLWQRRLFAWQEQWGLSHNQALTVASRTLQGLAWSHGIPPHKVHYLPNGPGISSKARRADQKRTELGLAGRAVVLLYSRLFEFDTGRLITILQQVLSEMPDSMVLTVGASLFKDDAERMVHELAHSGFADRFVNAGWIEEKELPNVLAAADVGLYLMDDTLLNRSKCPVKLADMLGLGLPVVAENVGQVPEYVIHGTTGLLRSSGEVSGLAADLIELLQNKDQREQLGAAARDHIQANFSWERLADIAEIAYAAG